MNDRDFLTWLADRLVHVYNENPNVDYVSKLKAIAAALPADQITANVTPRHGCYCDLGPGEMPDGCVWDDDAPGDCTMTAKYKTKEKCPWWRPIWSESSPPSPCGEEG